MNADTVPKRHKRGKRLLLSFFMLLLLLSIGCAVYIGDGYPAQPSALSAAQSSAAYAVQPLADGSLAFVPEDPVAGLIFYPGGKVDHTAYAPLMAALADNHVLCVLVKMPLRLAVLKSHAADGITDDFPSVSRWYIGGHSLGGAMAAGYVAKHTDAFEGLLLLGAYSTADLSGSSLRVLSIYGSEDGVMNREKYLACRANLPSNATEVVIPGGCHAYFGDYGPQKGDGTPSVSREEQLRATVEAILRLISAA